MRLVILQVGFGAGGAEKVVAMLAAHRAAAGDEVHVAALGAATPDSYFPYPPGVRRHALAAAGPVARLAAIRRLLRDLRPDLAIAFLTKVNALTLTAGIGLPVPVIVSERNNPARQAAHPLWRPAQALLMRRAAAAVMQTDRARQDLPRSVRARAHVIANPCEPLPGLAPAGAETGAAGPVRLVAVGRLDRQKGFDLLIAAFARMHADRPARLTIFGEGPERAQLTALAHRLGVAEKVEMPGATDRPGGWIGAADLLVVPSRFEGFPNVIAEAVVTGLPVVAFDCDYGPRELIRPGENGLLVPPEDVSALAAAMTRLAGDPALRRRMAAAAGPSRAALDPARILSDWDRLIASVPRPARADQAGAPASALSS
ncbi:glycosyltransferase [Frigidibacter oleivorans]|uniref:glycosyltransferase n=1 Tax=Frigidibacter oleivorans TaxID=2487129 RepID=UPI000F8C6264|nr:glycosyltransferase [Frigidibacter oleivorans]